MVWYLKCYIFWLKIGINSVVIIHVLKNDVGMYVEYKCEFIASENMRLIFLKSHDSKLALLSSVQWMDLRGITLVFVKTSYWSSGTPCNLRDEKKLHHQVEWMGGVCCSSVRQLKVSIHRLQLFYWQRREVCALVICGCKCNTTFFFSCIVDPVPVQDAKKDF